MKNLLLLICTLLLLESNSFGQNQNTTVSDSLFHEAQIATDAREKVIKNIEYVDHYFIHSHDKGIQLIDSLISVYEADNNLLGLAFAKSQKGWYLIFKSDYKGSLKIGHEALQLFKSEVIDTIGLASNHNRIALSNLQFERYNDAEKHMQEALKYFLIKKDSARIDMVYNNLGIVANEQNDYSKAINYYEKSLDLRIKQKSNYWVAYQYYNISQCYYNFDKADSTTKYIHKAVWTFENKTKSKIVPSMVLIGLAEEYMRAKQHLKAIDIVYEAIAQSEKLGNTEMLILEKELLAKLLFEVKNYKLAYELNQEFIELKTKTDSTNNAAQAAEIEEKYQNAENKIEITRLKAINLEVENRAAHSKLITLYTLLASSLIIFVFIILYFRKNHKQKVHQSAIETKMSEFKMMALRSQMNPHFVFNCINTAQDFVLDAKKENAYQYLSKFASLLRIILENASKSYIAIEDEIKHIQLYLELESIRFYNTFDFHIDIDERLKEGVIEIPAMLIQPFVENAIVHGLINLNDERKGELNINLQREENLMVCTISDNGVGREYAKMIKAQKQKFYQSVAIPNIKERLLILKDFSDLDIGLKIEDIKTNGIASGTKITLTIPIQ